MPPKKTLAGNKKEAPKKEAPKPASKSGAKSATKPGKNDKALVKTEEKAVSTNVLDIMAESSGAGADMFGAQDVQRPNIKLMQSNSPYINKRHEKYVDGAEDGDILVTGTQDLFSESIRLIVVGYARNYVEWKPRDSGGGLIGAHPYSPEVVQGLESGKGGAFITEEGNELIDTMTYFVLYENNDGDWLPAMLFFKSTMLSAGRDMNTKLNRREVKTPKGTVRAPVFANIVTLEVVSAKNDQGTWNKFKVGDIEFIDDAELLQLAKREHEAFRAGAKIDFSASTDHDVEVVDDDDDEEGEGHF